MGENCHFKLSIHSSAPFTVPIWYYTTQHNDVAILPGRFIFQPYVSKDQTSVDRPKRRKKNLWSMKEVAPSCLYAVWFI